MLCCDLFLKKLQLAKIQKHGPSCCCSGSWEESRQTGSGQVALAAVVSSGARFWANRSGAVTAAV